MENNNGEVAEMRQKYSELLKDISYICNRVNQKSEKVLSEMKDSIDELDINSLEKMGLQIAKMLETLKANSIVHINYLLKELALLNENRPEKLFSDMNSKLLDCRSGTVIVERANNVFAQLAEKGTLTEDLECNSATKFFTNTFASTSENNWFRLRREATTDTIQTEDSWEDTLQRTKGKHCVKIEDSIEFPEVNTKEDNFNDTTMIVDNQAERGTFEENYTMKKENIDFSNDLVKDDSGLSENDLQEKGLKDGEKDEEKSHTSKNQQGLLISSSDDELYSAPTQLVSKKRRRRLIVISSSESEQISEDKSENETKLQNSDDDNTRKDKDAINSSKAENKLERNNRQFSMSDNFDPPKYLGEISTSEKEYQSNDSNCFRKNTTSKQTDSISIEEKCLNSPDLDVDCAKDERNSSTNNEANVSLIEKHVNSPDLFSFETNVTDIENNRDNQSTDKEVNDVETCIESTINKKSVINNGREMHENDSKPLKDNNLLNEDEGTNKESDHIQEYANPYSIETEKISSEEEPEQISGQQNVGLMNEHSYSCASASDLEDSSPKSTNPKKKLESAHIELTDNESNTNIEDISERTNELEKIESDSNSPIHNNRLEDNDENRCKKGDDNECILNEHNYSSPSSNGIDTDETDIEKEIDRIELNSDKVTLENSEHKAEDEEQVNSNTCSNQSYEFDISSYPKLEEAAHNSKDLKDVDCFAKELEKLIVQEQMDQHNEENKENRDILMEVTLEEILSDCEENHTPNSSLETIPYYNVNIEKPEIKLEESDGDGEFEKPGVEILEEPENIAPTNNVADELLALFGEVPEPPFNDWLFKPNEKDNDENVDVDSILQKLQEDDSELSDSVDSLCSLNLSDISGDSSNHIENVISDDDEKQAIVNKHNLLECYVPLERLHISEKQLTKVLDNDIDWLCDLNNLVINRKTASSPLLYKQHRKKRRRRSTDGSSESLSSFTSQESEDFSRSNSPNLSLKQKERLDEILATAICNDFERGSDKSSDTDSNDDSCDKKETKKNNLSDKRDEANKKSLTKEELEKKAWRKDPLLIGRFSVSESSNDEIRTRKKKVRRYEDDTEYSIKSDELDSDSDNQEILAKNTSNLEENEISPIKKNIPISDTSDSDNDVQYVSPIKTSKIQNNEEGSIHSQKGRRNIRSIVSDQFLAEKTQRANKEELERIERLKDRNKVLESLSQSFTSQELDGEEENPLILDINEQTGEPLVQVHPIITKKLKSHQRLGIQFMWNSCYESLERIKHYDGSGCILAHCMGLGKTLQVLTLVHTLFAYDQTDTKHVLIVCPLSTVSNWKKELKFTLQGLEEEKEISLFTLPSKKDICYKYEVVTKWYFKRKKSILVLGYEGFETLTNEYKLGKNGDVNLKKRILEALVDPGPCLVVCDEGHLIRNKTAVRTMALNNIRTKRRIVLTGTPLQNNLVEYYHMVHFVKPNLLGTIKEFKTNFVNPITNGQYEDSTNSDIKLMRSRTHVLHKILAKTVQRVEDTELEIYLPKMLDHAVFIQLHQVQVDLYNQYSNSVRHSLETNVNKRFLADFHMFQYLCTHPHLLALMESSKNKKVKEQDVICEDDEPVTNLGNWWKDKMPTDARDKIEYGHKLLVLKAIIEECEAVGDKLLVFSQKIAELDLIEHFLKTIGTKQCQSWKKKKDYDRMDGTVSPDYRTTICDNFNDEKNNHFRLLLMSTKVGGLGLNLTAANRVVIMTVHWNPSYDTQSVFRVYRFGQKKQVYVYRLISLDTMEEKVYQRSVTKLAIARRVVDKHQITRHYKSVDLQEIYSCQPTADNERPTPNVPEDEVLAKLILKLPFIFKYHEHKALLADRPEDKLTEQEMTAAWEEFKNKDYPTPAPAPSLITPQQQNNSNGPTFEQAYKIGRYNLNQASTSKQQINPKNIDVQLQNYYLAKKRLGLDEVDLTKQNPQTWSFKKALNDNMLQKKRPSINSINTNLGLQDSLSSNVSRINHSIQTTSKPQYNSSVSDISGISNSASNKQSRKLVQNPFSNEGTSSSTNSTSALRPNTTSQVTPKPVKRKFGSTEVVIKKMKNFINPSASTANELFRQITTNTNNSNIKDTIIDVHESLTDNINHFKGLMSRGVTVSESSKTDKENDGVISLL